MEIKGCKTEEPEFGKKFNIKNITMSYVGKNNVLKIKEELLKIERYLKEHGISDRDIIVSEWYGDNKREIGRSINGIIIKFNTFECDIRGLVCVGLVSNDTHKEYEEIKVLQASQTTDENNVEIRPIYIFHTHIDYIGDIVVDEYNKFAKELIKTARGAGLKMALDRAAHIMPNMKSPYLDPVFYTVENSFELESFKKFLWNIKYICSRYAVFN